MPFVPRYSPWGEVDHSVSCGEGVYFVSTPSHGGLALAPEIAATLPKSYLAKSIRQGSWTFFEEDCACCLVFEARPDIYRATLEDRGEGISNKELLKQIKISNRRWYPELFDLPANCAHCHGQHSSLPEGTLIVFSAFGSWYAGVPQGYVGVSAGTSRNASRRGFLISEAEYAERDVTQCFVVDPDRHRPFEMAA